VETSKGYADFINVIETNPWGYRFFHMLFPSLLQGDHAVQSLLGQLRWIRKVKSHFDVVAIIRGGGGDVGLSCYNDFDLAKEVATFPLPLLTGIGHSTNETVVELVANKNNITPTKLAEFLIQKFHNFSVPVKENRRKIVDFSRNMLSNEKTVIADTSARMVFATRKLLEHNSNSLDHLKELQQIRLQHFFLSKRSDLEKADNKISILDPVNVLKRGYSITYHNGKVLKDTNRIKEDDEIKTTLFSGKVISIVKTKTSK
jgi:exodeoxyribonuclease VII large subunit